MKKRFIIYCGAFLMTAASCSDFLDIKPLDKVAPEQVFSDINGVKAVLATLYNKMPVEDFAYNPAKGFNYRKENNNWTDLGWSASFYTDEAVNSAGSGVAIGLQYWDYGAIRQVNQFMEALSSVKMEPAQFDRLVSEAHFIRAYMYFALVKRYGGVPLITHVQQMDEGDKLYVPRSTEKATWDFVLEECDKAIAYLPESVAGVEGTKRATKWSAYALKSRVALFAASVAKYWDKSALVGEAVDQKLVGGFTSADAIHYYEVAASTAKTIMDLSGKRLYKPQPQDADEVVRNYKKIFEEPTDSEVLNEVLFSKGYIDGSVTAQQGHSIDVFFNPSQTNPGFWAHGRFSPVLDLIDVYEDYKDDGIGASAPLRTREDGAENQYIANPGTGIDLSVPYVKYDTPTEIFKNKDARLAASVILPGSVWKGQTIVMQGGLIAPNGTQYIYQDNKVEGKDGKTYYTYGGNASHQYSGFRNIGTFDDANFTITGFCLKKFLQEGQNVAGMLHSSSTDYIDMRLAEIYLNYAEAVAESGKGDAALAEKCLNDLRKRAGHTDEIPLTVENVLKERRVELAFEGQRYWDLIRRRDSHLLFNGSATRKALVPILDLRDNSPKYIFVRANSYFDNKDNGRRFDEKSYYLAIPGVATNGLVQNPQY